MTLVQRQVLGLIRSGREHAIKGGALARLLGFRNDRAIRRIILELIGEGYPIASGTGVPAGYFLAQTPGEVEAYARELRSRLIKDALRRRDFLRASRPILQPEQLVLLEVS